MESWVVWLCELGPYAPLLIFGLLIVTGFSLPVSEDLILLASGALASTLLPHLAVQLFLAAFLGSYFSDCIAFGLGRFFGGKFQRAKSEKQMGRLSSFYKKYGILTLFVGRLIPFGFRNGIFMTAGAGKMHFRTFLISDGIACLVFSGLLFFLAYSAGKNYESLAQSVQQASLGLGLFVLLCIGALAIYLVTKRKKKQPQTNQSAP